MKTFDEFYKGRNRVQHPPNDRHPNGYVSVELREDGYNDILRDALQEAASICSAKSISIAKAYGIPESAGCQMCESAILSLAATLKERK